MLKLFALPCRLSVMFSYFRRQTPAVIGRLFTAILRINAATAAQAHCTTHIHFCRLFTFIEKMYMILQKFTQPVSGKRNIWTNSMYKDFLPAIAFLHLQCWINYYWWETDAGWSSSQSVTLPITHLTMHTENGDKIGLIMNKTQLHQYIIRSYKLNYNGK